MHSGSDSALDNKSLKTGSDSAESNSLTTNNPDHAAIKVTVPVLSNSPGDVGEMVGSVIWTDFVCAKILQLRDLRSSTMATSVIRERARHIAIRT